MGRVTSYGTKGTETGTTITRRKYEPGQPAVIYCHGLNGQAWHPINFPEPTVDLLAERGFPVAAHDLGGVATWGNDTAQTKIGDARTYMQAAPISAAAGPVLLWAGSMGTLAALNYARNNPANVLAVACGLPPTDLADLHDNNRPIGETGVAASIEAAYGGLAGYNAARAAHNPAEHTAEYASLGVPIKLWYSGNDTTVIPSTVTTFASAAGIEAVNVGSVGHTFPSAYADDVVDWLTSFA